MMMMHEDVVMVEHVVGFAEVPLEVCSSTAHLRDASSVRLCWIYQEQT